KNPWKIENTSSGSSAGSASATSAGLVGFSLGTETLGSIISPSSTCGVVGLRPTYGRVSRYGAMGLSWTMDKIGPICRGVEDCALVLDAIYGPDGHDTTVASVPFTWTPDVPLSKLRFGYLQGEFDQLTGERKAVYEAALDVLRKAGAKLEPVELPKFSTQSLRIILEAEAATAFDDLTRSGGINQLSGQSPNDWPNTFRTARFIPAVEYIQANRIRTLLMAAMDEAMRELDRLARMNPGAPEYSVTRTYVETIAALPWHDATTDDLDLKHAKVQLDNDHFGLEKIKDRILEFLAVRKVKTDGKIRQPILLLVGPPGVGKTSLGRSIADAMGRTYTRISLGGMRDEAEIRGHRRTYVGAMPGQPDHSGDEAGRHQEPGVPARRGG
ncbi:MAG: hypothetical protein C4320_04590, partial [Armatimonadota bacterium]